MFLFVFLVGYFIIDTLNGDVLRCQLEVALGSKGSLLKFTFIVEFPVGSTCCGHLNVLGHNAHLAFLVKRTFTIEGDDAHRVGGDDDTRLLVVAQVVLAVGRCQADVLTRNVDCGSRRILLEVVAFLDLRLLVLETLKPPVGLCQHRQNL